MQWFKGASSEKYLVQQNLKEERVYNQSKKHITIFAETFFPTYRFSGFNLN